MLLHTHCTIFSKFHIVCNSQPPKICCQTTVQACRTLFELPPFWIVSNQIFLWDWNHFCYKLNQCKFYFVYGKIPKKSIFPFKKKSPLIHWTIFVSGGHKLSYLVINFLICPAQSAEEDYRIHRLHLHQEVRRLPPNMSPAYEIKPSDGETSALKL